MKYLAYVVLFLIAIFAVNYTFNHINPWIAYGLVISIAFLTIYHFKQQK
jgi:hypothetical protein